jgi:acyl carrier protein
MDSKIPVLHRFIVDNFLFGENGTMKNDTNFFEKGIIDSTGILELVSFIEEEFNVTVEDDEIVTSNFSSLNAIDHFLEVKLTKIGEKNCAV